MQAARHEVHSQQRDAVTTASKAISFLGIACLITCLILCLAGCATLTIPAIDPSGNRIFSSVPTQLTLPQLHGPNGQNIVPNSSFPEPPTPPNCLQGPEKPVATLQNAGPRSTPDRGRCGQMLLTPTRIVAPVGGEVVLIAGVCGEDGYLVSGEPIEWMLAPDSVGEIIEVGDDMKGKRKPVFKKSAKPVVEKLDVDFARGRTSSEAGRITRGSFKPTDDIALKKGQTWVSLTSPTEGLSRVTVLAPDSDVWDRRRQTATIYWVDASWQFPAPQTLRVGEIATLITQVKKAEGFAPAKDWIVKYRLMNEGVGQFLTQTPGGGAGIDQLVDSDAKAVARLGNPSNKPGTAIVSIEIARPAQGSEKMPELPIARGQTMITWSAPLLQLQVTGNDTTMVGQPIEYQVRLSNAGDLAAENVRLTMDMKNPSLQAEYDQQTLPTEQSNLGAVWNIGMIPARQVFEARIRITPSAESDNRIQFNATASPNLAETATVPLLAVKPQVTLKFAPELGMEQVEVGQPTIFKIVATNTGRTTLNAITLLIDTDVGLQHADGGSNVISQTIPYLPPGQSQELGVRFIVRKAGELGARLIAKVGGIQIEERKTFVRGVEATPRQSNMSVLLRTQNGTTQIAPNAEVNVQGLLQNRGQTTLTNIQMLVEYQPSLALTQASQGINHRTQDRQLTWSVPVLEPGKQLAVEMVFRSIAGSPPPSIRITARSAEGMNAQESLNFNQSAGAGNEPPVLPFNPTDNSVLPTPGAGAGLNPSAVGNNPWSLSIIPIDSQVTVGQSARYNISFQNNRPQADQNVRLEFLLPQGAEVLGLSLSDGAPVATQRSDDGRRLLVAPFQSLRSGEVIQLVLGLKHGVPGADVLEIFLQSASDQQGARQQSRISVRPNLQ